jgi:hypothetical protein
MMPNNIPIEYFIRLSELTSGKLAQAKNMNSCLMVTSSNAVLNSQERSRKYFTLSSVEADFGTSSVEYNHASAMFSSSPNPVNVGGFLQIGYWRAIDETTADTAARITTAQLQESVIVTQIKSITDGSITIDIDGTPQALTGIDFTGVISLDDVIGKLSFTGVTVAFSNGQIDIKSDTLGASSLITYAYSSTGTGIQTLLGLGNGDGSTIAQGVDSQVLTAETQLQALSEIENSFTAFYFIDNILDADLLSIGAYAKASEKIGFYYRSSLNTNSSNPVFSANSSGLKNLRGIYTKTANAKMPIAYIARAFTVNFNAENSALTMQHQELSVPAEDITEAELIDCNKLGFDCYAKTNVTTYDVITSGSNGWFDTVYNSIALSDALKLSYYNLQKSTPTKLNQTTKSHITIKSGYETVAERFKKAGVLAPNKWNSPFRFGDIESFNEGVEKKGYFIHFGPLDEQDQASRVARKSTVFQGAFKFGGAIHSTDFIYMIEE